jgi:SAM-dependent methyltransferase
MSTFSVRDFYDELAADYHLMFADWDASMARQAEALDGLVRLRLGEGPFRMLDCSCGIGTQSIGLALRGHRIVGTDLSPAAASRATVEAAARGTTLPFGAAAFDIVLAADNSLPHLLTAQDVDAALLDMRRVLRDDGLLVISVRDYEEARRTHPTAVPPQVSQTPAGQAITFQLWNWHADGERYDLAHFQLVPTGDTWDVRVRRTTYWALTRRQLTGFVSAAGFTDVSWHTPADSGFFQPVLTARRPASTVRRPPSAL